MAPWLIIEMLNFYFIRLFFLIKIVYNFNFCEWDFAALIKVKNIK